MIVQFTVPDGLSYDEVLRIARDSTAKLNAARAEIVGLEAAVFELSEQLQAEHDEQEDDDGRASED